MVSFPPCGDPDCPMKEAIFLFWRSPYVMEIIYHTLHAGGTIRFKDLEADMKVSPHTLSRRLKELVAAGVLEREAFDEMPPRVEYRATPRLRALKGVFGPFFQGMYDWSMAAHPEHAKVHPRPDPRRHLHPS